MKKQKIIPLNGKNMRNMRREGASIHTLFRGQPTAIFDEKKGIKKLQTNLTGIACKYLGLVSSSTNDSLAQIYYEVCQRIVARLPENTFDAVEVLTTRTTADTDQPMLNIDDFAELKTHTTFKKARKTAHPAVERYFYEEDEDVEIEATAKDKPESLIKRPEFSPDEIARLTPVTTKKAARLLQEIEGNLAGQLRYRIELFNVKPCIAFTPEMQEARHIFEDCSELKEAERVKIIFALANIVQSQGPVEIVPNAYGRPTIRCTQNVDPSLAEKLNVDHLFTKAVDHFLKQYGIFERKSGHIKISIPGRIIFQNGIFLVGFFQYSANEDSLSVFHRCFVEYNNNIEGEHISDTLRLALCDYLKDPRTTKPEYAETISHLEKILKGKSKK